MRNATLFAGLKAAPCLLGWAKPCGMATCPIAADRKSSSANPPAKGWAGTTNASPIWDAAGIDIQVLSLSNSPQFAPPAARVAAFPVCPAGETCAPQAIQYRHYLDRHYIYERDDRCVTLRSPGYALIKANLHHCHNEGTPP